MKRGALATIPEIALAYGISRAHLMKVVPELGRLGYVDTVRGRNGGLTLRKPAESIRIGEVLRHTEETLAFVECFTKLDAGAGCRIDGSCRLKGMLAEAQRAFFEVLDRYSLADVVEGRAAPLRRLLRVV
ncbi:MAG TPA: Rrf2 family transcriptional regulator [Polyangiaceae bacterium]|nr:Rrf2 family transcriptional regulator [Polyangiaceae bacterium]